MAATVEVECVSNVKPSYGLAVIGECMEVTKVDRGVLSSNVTMERAFGVINDRTSAAPTTGADDDDRQRGRNCDRFNCASFHRSLRVHFGGRRLGEHHRRRRRRRRRQVTLGDFFRLRIPCPRTLGGEADGYVPCIGELQLLWSVKLTKDDQQQQDGELVTLAACRFYFRPQDTPGGRRFDVHGQDELIALSETIVVHLKTLVQWMDDDDDDDDGNDPSVTIHRGPVAEDFSPKSELTNGPAVVHNVENGTSLSEAEDKEKEETDDDGSREVIVLPYGRYCRYRALMRRLQPRQPPSDVQLDHQKPQEELLDNHATKIRADIVRALGDGIDRTTSFSSGGGGCGSPFFCRETFDQLPPHLQSHPDFVASQQLVSISMRDRLREAFNLPRSRRLESHSSHNKWLSSSSPSSSTSSPAGKSEQRQRQQPVISCSEQEFLQTLFEFMRRRKTPIERVPSLGFKQVNLFAFYMHAKRLGGYEKITVNKLWKRIYDKLGGNPGSTSAATTTRRHYERLLLPFERHFGGGCNEVRVQATVMPSTSAPMPSPLVPRPPLERSSSADHATAPPPHSHHQMPPSIVPVRSAEQHQQQLLASARMRLSQRRKLLMSNRTAEKERLWDEIRKQSALERDRMRQMSIASRSVKAPTLLPRYRSVSSPSDGPIRVAMPTNDSVVERPVTVRVIRPSTEVKTGAFPLRVPQLPLQPPQQQQQQLQIQSRGGLVDGGYKRLPRPDDKGVNLSRRLVPLPVLAGLRPMTTHRFRLAPAPTDVTYLNGSSTSSSPSCATPRMISVIQRAHALILMGASPIVKDSVRMPAAAAATTTIKHDSAVRHLCDLQRSSSTLLRPTTFSVTSKPSIQQYARSMSACSRGQVAAAAYQQSGEAAAATTTMPTPGTSLCGHMDGTANGRHKTDAEVLDLTVRP